MHTLEEIWSKLGEIVAEVLGIGEVTLTPETTAKDVAGWDSITNIQIMVAIEKSFNFRFRTGEMSHLENVGQLVERISHRVARR